MVRSNNGSNFIGFSVGLIHAFQEMDHSRMNNYSHGREWFIWKRNPPFAHNIGGGGGGGGGFNPQLLIEINKNQPPPENQHPLPTPS